MSEVNRAERLHNLDVTVWVGKHGIESVRDELDSQLDDREMVKVKFHRSARAGTETAALADELATVADTRGHTAVIARD
ncbi:MAG: RNA-binding protein [Halobacteriales archaeon SW_8_66_22]|nr:MAG: RNA-binding protein [Halobacteriales archaeon SW_8_66_22]